MNKKSKTASDQTIMLSDLKALKDLKDLEQQIYIAACFVAGIYEGMSGKPFRTPKNNCSSRRPKHTRRFSTRKQNSIC